MTTLIVNNKVVRIHASTVTKVQNMIEHGKSTGEIAALIRFTRPATQALVTLIKEHAQMGRVA